MNNGNTYKLKILTDIDTGTQRFVNQIRRTHGAINRLKVNTTIDNNNTTNS